MKEMSMASVDVCPLSRSMTRLEWHVDASFAPQAGKSVHGMNVLYGGCPIHCESARQSCVAASTAEAELYGNMKGMVMPDSGICGGDLIEEVPYRMDWTGQYCNMWEKEMEKVHRGIWRGDLRGFNICHISVEYARRPLEDSPFEVEVRNPQGPIGVSTFTRLRAYCQLLHEGNHSEIDEVEAILRLLEDGERRAGGEGGSGRRWIGQDGAVEDSFGSFGPGRGHTTSRTRLEDVTSRLSARQP